MLMASGVYLLRIKYDHGHEDKPPWRLYLEIKDMDSRARGCPMCFSYVRDHVETS